VPADERSPGDTDEVTASDASSGSDTGGRDDANADDIGAEIAGDDGLGDPRDGLQDPAENVPTPEVPDVDPDVPDAPEPDSVPEGLRAEFWEFVFAANVALFGLSLGAMLVAFEENVSMGVLSLLVGTLAALFLAYRYLNRQHTP
jgi:hypothetical protein